MLSLPAKSFTLSVLCCLGVISLRPHGLLSVFGHELAHTMGGPPNDRGELAGNWAHGNQGESHAGWFQGKVNTLFGEGVGKSNRDCNRFFTFDKTGRELDLAMDRRAYDAKWKKGQEWTKIWWVWQKLDDRAAGSPDRGDPGGPGLSRSDRGLHEAAHGARG